MLILGEPAVLDVSCANKSEIKKTDFIAQGIQGKKVFPVTQHHGLHSYTKETSAGSPSSSSASSTDSDGDTLSDDMTSCYASDFDAYNQRMVILQQCEPSRYDVITDGGGISPPITAAAAAAASAASTAVAEQKQTSSDLSLNGQSNDSGLPGSSNSTNGLTDEDLPIYEEVMHEVPSERETLTATATAGDSSDVTDVTQLTDKDAIASPTATDLTSAETYKSLEKLISRSVRKAFRRRQIGRAHV